VIRFSGSSEGFDAVNGGAGSDDRIEAMANGTVIGLRNLQNVETIIANSFSGVTIVGSGAADTLAFNGVTLTGIQFIDGGGGNDAITGSSAADTIIGGAGNDTMNGGPGLNIFRFAAGFGADVINGFDANPNPGQDLLDISALGITAATFAANVTITGIGTTATLVTIGANTIQINGANNTGAAAQRITQADFILA